MPKRIPWSELRAPSVLLATWGGAGLSPFAPGTVGSLAALPLVFVLEPLSITATMAAIGLLTLVGIRVCDRVETRWGDHDHGAIVIDEVVGQWLAVAIPLHWIGHQHPAWVFYGGGFLLFRLFDITKPFPISWLDQKVSGGLGVMIDDVLAGLLAAGTLLLLAWLLL